MLKAKYDGLPIEAGFDYEGVPQWSSFDALAVVNFGKADGEWTDKHGNTTYVFTGLFYEGLVTAVSVDSDRQIFAWKTTRILPYRDWK